MSFDGSKIFPGISQGCRAPGQVTHSKTGFRGFEEVLNPKQTAARVFFGWVLKRATFQAAGVEGVELMGILPCVRRRSSLLHSVKGWNAIPYVKVWLQRLAAVHEATLKRFLEASER